MASPVPPPLRPTLWRTCRALANRPRLRLLRHLLDRPNRTVSDVAEEMEMPPAVVSQYLRVLNARSLLRAERAGRSVFYRPGADRSLPDSARILTALGRSLGPGEAAIEQAFSALTGFTHPRRIAMVQILHDRILSFDDLRRRTGIPARALRRHLRKLCGRGYIVPRGDGYAEGDPRTILSRTLLRLARGG